ncbi:hypothetical protein GCM10009837_63930 [Streptomyces durmitorensis]|uniref:hypothetical protein n=1 Tax=Streptomyces durmitorensis TaxID=319947 RepID=UPI003388A6FC
MNAYLACVLVLAAGTYAFRLAGPVLHGRIELTVGATVLLATRRGPRRPTPTAPAPATTTPRSDS